VVLVLVLVLFVRIWSCLRHCYLQYLHYRNFMLSPDCVVDCSSWRLTSRTTEPASDDVSVVASSESDCERCSGTVLLVARSCNQLQELVQRRVPETSPSAGRPTARPRCRWYQDQHPMVAREGPVAFVGTIGDDHCLRQRCKQCHGRPQDFFLGEGKL